MLAELFGNWSFVHVSVCVTAALLLTDSCLRGSGRRTSEKTIVATQTTPPLAHGALPLTPGHT